MTKRRQRTDRLSSLPDSLLIDIISRVACTKEADIPSRAEEDDTKEADSNRSRVDCMEEDAILRRLVCMKEAAKTAVLSKQWRFLWTNLPFEFHDHNTDPDKIDKFVARVYAMLAVRRGPALRTLDFSLYYYDRLAPDVDSWLHFAAENKVDSLKLFLKCDYDDDPHIYTLPQFLYSNSSLTELCLLNCVVIPRATVDWPCLKKLSLAPADMNLRQKEIDLILSGCPVLETLKLYECRGIERLHIGGRRFRHLVVRCDDEGQLRQISAPYMCELELELWCCNWMKRRRRSLKIQNVPYLEKATIRIYVIAVKSIREKVMHKIIQLFQDIRHVKTLHLSEDCIKAISIMASNGWKLPQLMVEDLTIDVSATDVRTICGVVAILESCPYLEKLAFDNMYCITEKGSLNWGPMTRDDLNCDLLRLKIIEFSNFVHSDFSGELVSTLARILLQRASILEEIVIINDETPFMSTEEIAAIKKKLLNHPKSSTKASVVVRKLNS